jgi:hypothetical protein
MKRTVVHIQCVVGSSLKKQETGYISRIVARDDVECRVAAYATPGAEYAFAESAGSVSSLSFSSTPRPLHKGHELRPVVSH